MGVVRPARGLPRLLPFHDDRDPKRGWLRRRVPRVDSDHGRARDGRRRRDDGAPDLRDRLSLRDGAGRRPPGRPRSDHLHGQPRDGRSGDRSVRKRLRAGRERVRSLGVLLRERGRRHVRVPRGGRDQAGGPRIHGAAHLVERGGGSVPRPVRSRRERTRSFWPRRSARARSRFRAAGGEASAPRGSASRRVIRSRSTSPFTAASRALGL